MPRGWEGNRRSGVTLAMRHGLKWFIHLRAQTANVWEMSTPFMLLMRYGHVCLFCVMVSGTRQLASVFGAKNWHQKQAPENGQCLIDFLTATCITSTF